MRWLRRLIVAGLVVGVWYFGWRFAAENESPVMVRYVTGELGPIALWKIMLAAFGGGAGLVTLYHMFTSARTALMTRRYRKTIGGLEAEVHQLRNLPLAPESDVKAAGAPHPGAPAVPVVGARD